MLDMMGPKNTSKLYIFVFWGICFGFDIIVETIVWIIIETFGEKFFIWT
jgi:hypothetical protein